MPAIAGLSTGGLPILSYKLEWNQGGSGNAFVALVGDTPNYSTDTSFLKDSLTTGTMYKFRYTVLNDVGWSLYSDVLTTYAAIVPTQLTAPTVVITPLYAQISWTP